MGLTARHASLTMKSTQGNSVPPRHPASLSVDDLTDENVRTIAELEEAARNARSPADRFADAVARFCGSAAFLWTHVVWFSAWIAWNTLPAGYRFDSFPFTFLTLLVSLEAIFLSTFILISQNAETRLAERRNHLDLQINLLAEQENTEMLKLLGAIAEKLGIQPDEKLEVLGQPAKPQNVVAQIERAEKPADAKQGTNT